MPRWYFIATAILFLTVSAHCVDYRWDGGGDGFSWGDPLNWDRDSDVPRTFSDRAIFDDVGGGTVNLGTGRVVHELIFSGDTRKTLTDGLLVFDDILHHGGTNTIAVRTYIAGTWSEVEVMGGRLDLTSIENVLREVNVSSGATVRVVAEEDGSALGNGVVNLEGGALVFLPGAPVTVTNALEERWYSGYTDAPFHAGMLAPMTTANTDSLLARATVHRQVLDTALSWPNDGAMKARSGDRVASDRFACLFLGDIHIGATGSGAPLVEGDVTFGTRSDDGSVIWLDGDGNGEFESPGEILVDNNGYHGAQNRVGSTNLAAGSYGIAIGFFERGGGAIMEARFAQGAVAQGAYNTMTAINPADGAQDGLFTASMVTDGIFSNLVTVAETSTIGLAPSLPSVSIQRIMYGPSVTLNVESADGGQTLKVPHHVIIREASSLRLVGGPMVLFDDVGESVPSSLALYGDGTLVFPTPNTYSGDTAIHGGVLEVAYDGALGTTGGVTTVHDGGALVIRDGISYDDLERLVLNGHGNAEVDAALLGYGPQVTFNGPVTLASPASIRAVLGQFRLRGIVDTVKFGLDFVADSLIWITDGGLTGDGTITKSGVDRVMIAESADAGTDFHGDLVVSEGSWICRVPSALGSANGGTTVLPGGSLVLRNSLSWSEELTLAGDGDGNGAVRSENGTNTLAGTISLASNSTVYVNGPWLSIAGPVKGRPTLIKDGPGTLVLERDNSYGAFELARGEVRVRSKSALGGTSDLRMNGPVTLAFDGNLGFGAGSPLGSIEFLGGTLRSVSGTTRLGIPVEVGPFADVHVTGAGDLVLAQPFGVGTSPYPADALSHYGYHINSDGETLDLDGNGGAMGQGDPKTFRYLHGVTFLTEGPGRRGLDFDSDADWMDSGAIGRGDQYSNLIVGYLNADETGNWELRIAQEDDRAGIWLDLDRDGVLESSAAGLGSDRGEQLRWENRSAAVVSLTAGARYLVAFTHREASGGAGLDVRYKSPSMGSEVVIKPSDPAQAGLWSPYELPVNNLVKTGDGTLTVEGNNIYSGHTDIRGGTLLVNTPSGSGTSTGTVMVADAVLGGTGIVGGDVHVKENGRIAPGASPGTLNLRQDAVLFYSSSGIAVELGGSTFPGRDYDQLQVGGALNVSGSMLEVARAPGYMPVTGETFVIAVTTGGVFGTFAGLPEGTTLSAQGAEMSISYSAVRDGITLAATGNIRTYAGPDLAERYRNSAANIAIADLLTNDLAATGSPGPLQVVGVTGPTPATGVVAKVNDTVRYYPDPGYDGPVTFEYHLSDGVGLATGVVEVSVSTNAIPPAEFDMSNLAVLPHGWIDMPILGAGGVRYDIERTDSLLPPVNWTRVSSIVPFGSPPRFGFTYGTASHDMSYFRLVHRPQ